MEVLKFLLVFIFGYFLGCAGMFCWIYKSEIEDFIEGKESKTGLE